MEGLSLDNMMTEEEAAALFGTENKQEEKNAVTISTLYLDSK